MSAPILKTTLVIRVVGNGFVCLYNSQEYVFLTVKDLNAWITATTVAG